MTRCWKCGSVVANWYTVPHVEWSPYRQAMVVFPNRIPCPGCGILYEITSERKEKQA